MTTTEFRAFTTELEARAGSMTIAGRAIQFGSRSRPIGGRHGFIEQVQPSFVNRAASSGYRGIVCRYSHLDQYLLGAVDSGTLRLSADDRGLRFENDVPQYHSFVYESVRRGDLRSASFRFANAEDSWDYSDGMALRTLHGGDLYEVGPCPIGQYEDATVGLRSLAAFKSAPFEDVAQRAESGRLGEFFVRSDNRSSATLAQRKAELTRMRYPQPTLSARMVELTEAALPAYQRS